MLFCIADTVCHTKEKYTAQEYDLQFGANTLGHLLFIRKLYHLLVSSTTLECPARVIWASSPLHSHCVSPFNYEALRDTPARSQKFITAQTLHESSKFGIVQLGLYMSRTMFKNDGVVMVLVDHPLHAESSSQKASVVKFVRQASFLGPQIALTRRPCCDSSKSNLAYPSVGSSLPTSTLLHPPLPSLLSYTENTSSPRPGSANPRQLPTTRLRNRRCGISVRKSSVVT